MSHSWDIKAFIYVIVITRHNVICLNAVMFMLMVWLLYAFHRLLRSDAEHCTISYC